MNFSSKNVWQMDFGPQILDLLTNSVQCWLMLFGNHIFWPFEHGRKYRFLRVSVRVSKVRLFYVDLSGKSLLLPHFTSRHIHNIEKSPTLITKRSEWWFWKACPIENSMIWTVRLRRKFRKFEIVCVSSEWSNKNWITFRTRNIKDQFPLWTYDLL